MKTFKILIWIHLISVSLYSQNLVLNPSFEDFTIKKKEKVDLVEKLAFCSIPNKGTPDVLNPLSNNKSFTNPQNALGYQKPHSGTMYIGIAIGNYLKSSLRNNFREYVTIELKEELHPNNLYCVGMFVSLANNCRFASDGLGVYLSKDKINSVGTYLLISSYFRPIVPNRFQLGGQIITDTLNWVLICDTIRAHGGEKFITIGNFKSDDSTKFILVNKKKGSTDDENGAYYYIDDVSVIASNGNDCKCSETKQPVVAKVETPQPIKENEPIVMEQLFFETNKYEILPKSFHYLDSLCVLLSKTTNVIEISGHTDNVGTEEDNLLLSENRAKAVMAYMVSKGILQTRVSAKGYGSTKPVTSNETEQGRATNRRVEFKILKR